MGKNKLIEKVEELRVLLNEAKPGDRSEADRRIAILLTDLEKIEALIVAWGIVDKEVPGA